MFTFDRNQRIFIVLMLAPALLVLASFYIYPSVFNIYTSLTDLNLLSLRRGGKFIGLRNYADIATSDGFRRVVWNTVFWLAIVSTLLRLILGLGLAVLINSATIARYRLRTIMRVAMLLPWATPPIVAVVVWRQFLDGRTGLINRVLLDIGAIDQPIAFLADANTVWPALLLISTHTG